MTVPMKTKDLIAALQASDPGGECVVNISHPDDLCDYIVSGVTLIESLRMVMVHTEGHDLGD